MTPKKPPPQIKPCKDHGLPYLAFHADAERRHKRGERQVYCGICNKWQWPEHVSDDHRFATMTKRAFEAQAKKIQRELDEERKPREEEEMSRDEMRAKLAELMGWRVVSSNSDDVPTCWINERYAGDPVTGSTCQVTNHPVAETVDFLLAALPKTHQWCRVQWMNGGRTEASCMPVGGLGDDVIVRHCDKGESDTAKAWGAMCLCVIAAYESERRRA